MAAGNSGSSGAGQKPKRNPVERFLVWGVIAALLALAGVEFWSRYGYGGYNGAQKALAEKMKKVDETADAPPVTEKDVIEAMQGKKPVRSVDLKGKLLANGALRVDEYEWFTVHPTNKLRMFVYYGSGDDNGVPEVLGVQSEEEQEVVYTPPTKEQMEEAAKHAANTPPGAGGAMGAGGIPPGRGPGRMMHSPGGPGGQGRPAAQGDASDEDKSDDAKSDDAKSDADKPDEEKSDEKPADDKPADEKPSDEKPSDDDKGDSEQ